MAMYIIHTALLLMLAVPPTNRHVLGSTGGTRAQDIPDKDYIHRPNYSTNTETVCGIITCPKGTQIKPCVENYTMDSCEDCAKGFEMLDETTSDQDVLPCREVEKCSDHAYAIDSDKENYCFDRTVRMRCECDVTKGRCGEPCNCKLATITCEPGKKLFHNCSCVPESSQIQTTEVTTKKMTIISTQSFPTEDPPTDKTDTPASDPVTPQPSRSQNSKITVIGSTPTTQHHLEQEYHDSSKCEDTVSWKTIGTGLGLLALLVAVVAGIYKRKELLKKIRSIWPCSEYRSPTEQSSAGP